MRLIGRFSVSALALAALTAIAQPANSEGLVERGTVVIDHETYQVRCTDASFCGKDASRADKARGQREAKKILKSATEVDAWMTSLGFENPRFMDQTGDGKRQLYITADTGDKLKDGCGSERSLACANALRGDPNREVELRFPENFFTISEQAKDITVAHEFSHTFVRRGGITAAKGVVWLDEAIADAAGTAWGVKQGYFKPDRFVNEDLSLDVSFYENADPENASYGYSKSRYLIRVGQEIESKDFISYLTDFTRIRDDGTRGMSYLYSEKLPENARFNAMFPRFVAELNETENVDSNGDKTEHFQGVAELAPSNVTYGGTNELDAEIPVQPFAAGALMFQELVAKDAPADAVMYAEMEVATDGGSDSEDIHLVYENEVVKGGKLQRAVAPNAGQMIGFVRLVNAPASPNGATEQKVRLNTTFRRMDFEWPKCVEAGKPFPVRTPSPIDFRQMKNLDFNVGGSNQAAIRQEKEVTLRAPAATGEQDMAVNIRPPSKHGGKAKKISLGQINIQKMCEPEEIGEWCQKLMNLYGDMAREAGAEDKLFNRFDPADDIRSLDGMNQMLMAQGLPPFTVEQMKQSDPACRMVYIPLKASQLFDELGE